MAGAPVSCGNDPNFGIILSFMEQFGSVLDIGELNIAELQSMLENSETVPQALADLHIKLMRKINKKVPAARWELALAKFAHSYSHQDAWEIERFGYKTANLAVKLRVLKALLEGQFDLNTKFKTQINTTGAGELRLDPLGRDRQGNCYWYFMDESANVQIYQSDPEMEAWTLVARNRDEFVNMIEMLKDNRPIEPLPAGNAVDEEDESAGSASDAEAMKLGTILAPSETPPSLIISRRTYKTCDKMNAPAAAEDEANAGEDSERSNSAAVEDDDVEMNSNAPPVASEPGDEKKNDISVEKGNEAEPASKAIKPEDTTTDAAPAECEVKTDDGVNEAMQCELDSKDEEMSTNEPTEGEQAEESAAIDKCIKKEEPVTEVEATKSEASAKEKEESHGEVESERVEKSGGEKETEEQRDAKEPEANGTAQPDPEKPVEVPQASHEESLPVETRENKEQEIVDKPDTEPAAEPAVGEAIEDPPVVVRGAGSGAECDSGIVPMFSEVIEEPIMFFYGAGAGVENGMGNTKKVEPALTAPESTTVNEAKPVGTKERVPSTDNAPVTSKAGNGERKPSSKGKPVKDGSSRSASKGPLVHSDEEEHANSECNEKKPLEETECTDNGGADHADPPSKGGELSAKDNDTMELGDRAVDDGCDGGNEDHEAAEVEPSQKKRTRKAPPEKPQKVTVAPRGKRSEKTPVETGMPVMAESVQEKPMEKKRGSRKSSTPKKALDSITATAILMQGSQEVKSEEQLKMESEEKPQPGAGVEPAEDIKPSSAEQEPNGDHLQQPQSSCAEDNSNGVKKEERKEVIVKEEGIADCKKESKSDLNELTELADPGEVKQGTAMVAAASKDITEETTDAIAAEKTPIKEEKKEELEKSLDGGASDKGGVPQSEGESPAKRKRRQRNGLVDGLDISMVLDAGSDGGNNPPVRQSRRIAMQKIKEETNRRQIEDEMLKKMKADAVKKKKDLGMHISDDEYRRTESTPDQSDSSSSGGGMGGDGRRRKKKKKKKKGSYQQQLLQQQQLAAQLLKKQTTWNSATSPESSSETEAEDYFAEPYHSEEDVRRSNVLKSDHEFSPESDLESEAPAQPLKRARTARKARRTRDVEAEEEEEDEEESDGGEDHACQECKKTDQPEWILLCDSCDKGYHCACLKPVLFTIPEGDWFCPVCQHRQLIERLQSKLELYDALQAKLVAEAKRREEEEQCAREAELAEQALEREREEQLRAQKRARQQQRLLERADSGRGRGGAGGNGRRSSRSRSASLDSSREEHQRQRRRRKQRQRNRKASKRRRSSRSRSGDGSGSGATGGSDDGSGGSGSGGSGSGGSGSCTDSDDIPIYKHLRRRASTKVSYKFNEYDNLIDSAIRREMRGCEMMEVEPDEEEDVDDEEGHGFSKGKDISTIIEATTREEQARKKAAAAAAADLDANEEGGGLDKDAIAEHDVDRRLNGSSQVRGENVGDDAVASPTGEEGKKSGGVRQDRAKATTASKKARKKKKKLCKIELSSEEEEDDSDEDFRGDVSGSDDEEEEDDDEEDEDENSMSGDSESSLEVGRRGRNAERSRKPSSRAAVSKRRRIVENSDDSEDEAEERRREIAKKNRKNRRVLDDSDEDLDLDDDDDEEDSEDYDSDDLCSDTETESSRSSDNSSNSSSSSSSSASTEGDWRRKKKKKTKGTGGGGKTKSKSAPSGGGGGGLGSGKHIERPPKKPSTATGRPKAMDSSGEDSGDSDSAGKGGKTMPRKPSKKSASRSSRSPESGKGGEKKSDRKTRGKKIHYIVDDDFESSDDGIRPGVQRPDTPPEEREQFIRRQEEIKRMLAENNAAKAKELATSKIDQLVGGGRAGAGSAKESAKDSLSDVPMQVIESARILDIDFLKSTSGNTARISTVDSVVDFDDELPEDFDPDDEMDDEALAKIMEEEDFAHHQLKAPVGVSASIASAADLLPPVPGPPPMKANRRKSIPDPGELLLPQQRAGRPTTDPPAASQTRKDLQHHHASPLPVNLVSSASSLPPPHVQSPMKALLKPTGIPTSTIMPPMVSTGGGGGGGGGTILANALQTTAAPHGHHAPMVPPPPLVKELPHPGASRADVLMRSLAGPPPPGGSLHHKPSDLSHLMAGLAGSGIALPLAKGGGAPLSLPPPPHTHHSSHRMPPVGLGMPPNMLGHGPPPHAPHLGLHTKLPPGVPPGAGHGSNVPHSAAAVAAAVAAASAAAAAAIGAGGASGPASAGPVPSSGIPHTTPTTGNPSTPTLAVGTSPHPVVAASAAERRPGRRKKITPLREDLKRRGNAAAGPPPSGEQQPSAVPSAAHQEQHQRLPPQHASQHHGHMVRLPAGPPPPPTSTAAPPVGLRPPIPPATSIHSTAHQNATAMAAAAAAAAAAQELAIKVHSRSGDGGGAGVGGPGMLVNEPPLSVPSSVAHLSYFRSENPLFAHRLGPLPSSILSSGSSSLQRIAAISGAAGPPAVYGDPTAYNGGWKPPPSGSSSKMKSTGSTQPPPPPTHPGGMMVGPPSIGSLEHYHEYNPANHYNPYYNVLDRAHLRPPPTIGELHRTSALSPTTFTTLQPLEFQHVMKPTGDNHHHHHSATSSPASTAGEDVGGGGSVGGGGRGSASSVERLAVPSHGGGPPPSSSAPASSETHPSVVEAASPPPSASVAVSVAPSTLVPPSAVSAVASTTASTTSSSSTSVFGELVSYFSSQQDDLDS